jgi:hypothetical protein
MNNLVNFSQQAAHSNVSSGMPVFGRVRVTSLRALPMTTGAVIPASGQKCALTDSTPVTAGYRLVKDVAVITGAFPGTSAWSPPI